jgi:hypothetical protein
MATRTSWFFNTDESEQEGRHAHEEMINQSCIAAWGYCRGQGADNVLRLPNAGEMVFLYRAGYGMVASGICTEEQPVRSRTVFAQKGEYQRHLINLKILPSDRPLSCATIRERTGYYLPVHNILCKIHSPRAARFLANYFNKYGSASPSSPASRTRPANDLPEPPKRVMTTTYRILRDTELSRRVKELHGYKCQICGRTIQLPDGTHYAEGHHIQPLGAPHNGPDILANILCLCPNHHAELDYGVRAISISALRQVLRHVVGSKYVEYHNRTICKR